MSISKIEATVLMFIYIFVQIINSCCSFFLLFWISSSLFFKEQRLHYVVLYVLVRESFCQRAASLKPAVLDVSDPAASCEGAAVEEENLPEWSVASSLEPNELD